MKIAIFSDSFVPYISGVTTVVMNQATELLKRGHPVTVFRPRPWRQSSARSSSKSSTHGDLELAAVPFPVCDSPVTIPDRRFPDLHVAVPTFVQAWRQARRFDPDIIHTHTEWGCGWEACLIARWLGKPLVGSFHTFYAEPAYLKHFRLPAHPAIMNLMWRYQLLYYSRCQAIITPSQSALEELQSRRIQSRPIHLANGIHAPPMLNDRRLTERRRTLGLDGGPHFIYLGRMAHEKSLEIVLQAFERVMQQTTTSKLILVGDGPSGPDVRRQVRARGLSERVVDLGMVPHDELIRDNVPRLGDVFVTASKTENHPLTVLESLIFGLPIIGPRARGIPELVEHGQNGFLFEPDAADDMARAMMRFHDEPALLPQMRDHALATGKTFLMDSIGDRLEAIYDEVLENSTTSAQSNHH